MRSYPRPIRSGAVTGLDVALVVIVVMGLGACTATPQILPIQPKVQSNTSTQQGAGRTIAIEVVDARGTDLIGLRDARSHQSAITAAPEMLRNIQQVLESGYRQQGFDIIPVGESADVALEVRLTQLGYQREATGLLKDLKTVAEFQVTSVMASKTMDGIYSASRTKDTVVRPSLAANADILNEHVNIALTKLIDDQRLTAE